MKQRKRNLAAGISVAELRDRLDRARAALMAVKLAPFSQAAQDLTTDLKREIRSLERDIPVQNR